jgi:hypothetical protein
MSAGVHADRRALKAVDWWVSDNGDRQALPGYARRAGEMLEEVEMIKKILQFLVLKRLWDRRRGRR